MQELIALGGIGPREKLLKRISQVLKRRADARGISLFALGTWRRQLPGKLADDYVDAAVLYTAASFSKYVSDFSGARFTITNATGQGAQALVIGDIAYASGVVHQVRFKLAGGPGNPRVTDVNVQGIWLSLQLRNRFTSQLESSKGNFDRLISWLEAESA